MYAHTCTNFHGQNRAGRLFLQGNFKGSWCRMCSFAKDRNTLKYPVLAGLLKSTGLRLVETNKLRLTFHRSPLDKANVWFTLVSHSHAFLFCRQSKQGCKSPTTHYPDKDLVLYFAFARVRTMSFTAQWGLDNHSLHSTDCLCALMYCFSFWSHSHVGLCMSDFKNTKWTK